MRAILAGEEMVGTKIVAGIAQTPRGERHRDAVIPARRRHHARRRDLAQQQVGERPTRLERARVLHQLQLHHQRPGGQAKVRAIHRDNRRATDVRGDALMGGGDALARDR